MTYAQVLESYKNLLLQNPNSALHIGADCYAVLDNGYLCVVTASQDGSLDLDSASDFDSSAFISDESRWDGDTAENLMAQLASPVFKLL